LKTTGGVVTALWENAGGWRLLLDLRINGLDIKGDFLTYCCAVFCDSQRVNSWKFPLILGRM